ncbi:MAG: amidohydrolase family protein [Bacteroidia bacterium]|nr:amidohydrolase family protein [Bacteroidia bacterium]
MRFLGSSQVFSGKEFLAPHTILVLDNANKLIDIVSSNEIDELKVEKHEGIITPGFINAHCHLELSHLKDKIKKHTGIVDFGLGVMQQRHTFSEELQIRAMAEADKEMVKQGIVAVGDISNTNLSISTKQASKIYYHTFVELIALNPEKATTVFDNGKQLLLEFNSSSLHGSLAPHAPYSASKELIQLISHYCFQNNSPTSIHNQESNAENNFFQFKIGDYLRLYEQIKLPIDYFTKTQKSSLLSVIDAFHSSINTLLVHNTFCSNEDMKVSQQLHHQLFWCLCPKANLYIENALPDITELIKQNCNLVIGTDSLASNSGLSIIDEINTICKNFPEIPLDILLQAATFNGAYFLGITNQFGELNPNTNCGINLIEGKKSEFTVKKLA